MREIKEVSQKVRLVLPKMHPKQKLIVAPRREKISISCCGTKFGKTLGFSIKCAQMLFTAKRPIQILWAAPYYENAKVSFKYMQKLLHHEIREINNTTLTITMKHNGAAIFYKGINHNPEGVEGEAYNYVVIDEASKMHPQGVVSIRTTTTATQAPIDIVSTPRGKGWFHEYWLRGDDPTNLDYACYRYPTMANPHISEQEIQIAQRQLSDRLFRQYYMAEFVDDSEVFLGHRECVYQEEQLQFEMSDRHYWVADDAKDRRVVIGVDWAKSVDFTVFTAIDYEKEKPRVVGFFRFQQVNYLEAVKYLIAFSHKFKEVSLVLHDKTGVGDALDDLLGRTGLAYEGIVWTHERKSEMVSNLILAFEQRMIEVPFWNRMIEELDAYEVQVNNLGKMRYNAPSGKHDDIVSSLMLAWSATCEFTGSSTEVRLLEGLPNEDMKPTLLDESLEVKFF